MSAGPDQAALLSRVEATDVEGLRFAVRTLRRVAGEYDRVAGRMNGVRAAATNFWQAGSQKSFDSYATRLTGDLSDAAAAMRDFASQLDGHAEATEAAQSRLRAAAGLATAGKYAADQIGDDSQEQRWAARATEDFHASEQKVRARLWALGTDAPGGIPLPAMPPQPHQNWWQAELFPSAFGAQQWLDSAGVPHAGNPRAFDPEHPLFGFDEDGNRVPAYEADPMAQHEIQDGIPLRGIFEVLGFDTAASVEDSSAGLLRLVTQSDKWTSGRINEHVREFFNLPGRGVDLPEHLKPAVPEWARQEFLRVIKESALASHRVFEFSTGDKSTFAFLGSDPATRQNLLIQFYRDGPDAGSFATAFVPNPRKLAAILEKESIVK